MDHNYKEPYKLLYREFYWHNWLVITMLNVYNLLQSGKRTSSTSKISLGLPSRNHLWYVCASILMSICWRDSQSANTCGKYTSRSSSDNKCPPKGDGWVRMNTLSMGISASHPSSWACALLEAQIAVKNSNPPL